jgi:uncharacterized cupredoxin-like copper-binding protein
MRRRLSWFGLVACVAIVPACGSDDAAPSTPADLTVLALDSLKFDKTEYTVAGGAVEIRLQNDGSQLHTLVIEDVGNFKLKVTGSGDIDQDSVNLQPGTYVLFCDVPGHRDGGMEATLTVS